VLLLGVPLEGRTEQVLRAEARAFGVEDRFELKLAPRRDEILRGLANHGSA